MALPKDFLDQLNSFTRPPLVDDALRSWRHFLHSQIIGSVILLLCTVVALLWANSPSADTYTHLLETPLAVSFGQVTFSLTLHQWLNEALMMAFFLLIGLEVKEQILVGELSNVRQALLPVGAALGGMLVPALIYLSLNQGGATMRGWGIPMSTDIAFALGILALLGKRIPLSLKVFLATLAIADDIGAILVITFFYSGSLNVGGLLLAAFFWFVIFAMGRLGIYNELFYFALSIGVWFGFFTSGIHATIAGIAVAIAIPAHPLLEPKRVLDAINNRLRGVTVGHGILRDHDQREAIAELNEAMTIVAPPLVQLQRSLQPLVTFVVMPLFALSNAGVALHGAESIGEALGSSLGLGILLGLVVGKPLGIALFSWLTVRLGLATLPESLNWSLILGGSLLAGIGFTMSLFVTELAFLEQPALAEQAKLSILTASLLAGVLGLLVLRRLTTNPA